MEYGMNKTIRVLQTVLLGLSVSMYQLASAQEVIRLGAPLALTGALADSGAKSKQGYDMCVAAVNARGGVDVAGKKYKLELVEYDYQSETNRAVQLVQRLINVDKVPFLLAPYGSGDTKATAAVAERYGIPMVAPSAAAQSIFDQNFKNLFGILFPASMITDEEVRYYKQNAPSVKRLAVLALNSLYPKTIASELTNSAQKAGYDIVYNSVYSPDTSDFSSVLTQIKALKPDWLYVTGYTQDLILVRKQMADVGMNAKLVTMTAGPAWPEFTDNLKGLADNVTTNAWWHQNANYSDNYIFGSSIKYNDAFKAQYKRDATYVEAASTAACETLALAIEAAKSTSPDAVRSILHERKFDTFYGPVQFGKSGQNTVNAALVLQIQKGKIVVLDPASFAQGKLSISDAH
jgi:branched-chain amino acid transport system substrate-binding protein